MEKERLDTLVEDFFKVKEETLGFDFLCEAIEEEATTRSCSFRRFCPDSRGVQSDGFQSLCKVDMELSRPRSRQQGWRRHGRPVLDPERVGTRNTELRPSS